MTHEVIETTGGFLTEEALKTIRSNICDVFRCTEADIQDLHPIQKGFTNIVLSFCISGARYIYRHPGAGSNMIVNRGREALMQKIAAELGVDTSVVTMDAAEGWRISRFIEHRLLKYHDPDDTKIAMSVLRKIHNAPVTVRWHIDPMKNAEELRDKTPAEYYGHFRNFEKIRDLCYRLYDYAEKDGIEKCYIQGDARDQNFLISGEDVYLIDWEFSGYGDPGYNLGLYFTGGDYSITEADEVLREYFQREPSDAEKRHYYAYIAITAWWSLHWMMLKATNGQQNAAIDAFTESWIRYAEEFGGLALKMYQGEGR